MNRVSDPLREKYLQADQRPNDKPIYGSSARQVKSSLIQQKNTTDTPKSRKRRENRW